MDPAAFDPSEELQEDTIHFVDRLINLWLEHEGKEFRQALTNRLQPLVSRLPWLFRSLHPLVQNEKLHLHPPAAATHPATDALLPGPTESDLPANASSLLNFVVTNLAQVGIFKTAAKTKGGVFLLLLSLD